MCVCVWLRVVYEDYKTKQMNAIITEIVVSFFLKIGVVVIVVVVVFVFGRFFF